MIDAVRPRQVRVMGQASPFGYNYNWNYAPSGAAVYPAPAPAPDMTAAGQTCYTCTDPSSGDTQYGVPSSMADSLRSKGYKCRRDECASNSGVQQVQQAVQQNLIPGIQRMWNGFTPSSYEPVQTWGGGGGVSEGGYGMLEGSRIPLAGGLGRRALT